MRPFILALTCVVVVAAGEPIAAQEGDAHSHRTIAISTPDSVQSLILGMWVPASDPTGLVTISTWGAGMVSIMGSGKYMAVGFFDGRELVGIMCPTRESGAAARLDQPGIIRARYSNGPRLDVEFARDLKGSAYRREVWKSQGRFAEKPEAEGGSPPSEELPKFGDYIYVEELPEAIERVPPAYPEWARKKGIEGVVLVQCLVNRAGRVVDTRIARSIPDLDDHAVAAAKQWRFKPAKSKGQPIAVWVAIPIKFSLR